MPITRKKIAHPAADVVNNDALFKLSFDHSTQASLIYGLTDGQIVMANNASAVLTGYPLKQLYTTTADNILGAGYTPFKKLLIKKMHASAIVSIRKRNRTILQCEMSSAVFLDEAGKQFVIATFADVGKKLLKQQRIDTRNKRTVATNIRMVESRQKKIDARKDRVVAHNIILARSKQEKIDSILSAYETSFILAFNSSSDV